MKKLFVVCLSGILVCFVFGVVARATIIETGENNWWIGLQPNQSFTCVAHYVWIDQLGDITFIEDPLITDIYFPPPGPWQTALSENGTVAYLYGPQVTNYTQSFTPVFSYILSYDWDPQYSLHIDMAIYDGPLGSEPIGYWGWASTPGDPDNWFFKEEPFMTSEPWYEEGIFSNPAPEATTLSLVGFGLLFLRKRRKV